MKIWFALSVTIIFILNVTNGYADRLQSFSAIEDLRQSQWQSLTFPSIARHTDYRLIMQQDKQVVHAKTNNSASALVAKYNQPINATHELHWRWKVSNIFERGDARLKSGDDYPARIYVAFAFEPENASLIERIKYQAANAMTEQDLPGSVLNYIWANKLPVNEIITNPHSAETKMIVVQSGQQLINQWISNKRNISADYRAAFGRQAPSIIAIGIMSDSDNTGESAEAWYGDVVIKQTSQN